MATPMTASQFVSALKKEGVNVREYKSWRTHNRNHKGAWGPVNGVVIHHTAGRNSLALCYNGTSGLPGPLCHTHLSKAGTTTMVSAGRANHAGSFAANAFNAMVTESKNHPRPDSSEPIDGNSRTYGIEIENLGNGTDYYPAKQYDQAVRWAAAICRFHGWTAQSVIGHKEGTRRKIDPKGPVGSANGRMWDMDDFRADVQARLSGKPTPVPAPKPTPAPAPSTAKTHTVRDGDTLWSISQKYNVSVAKLKSWNGLRSDTLSIGQKLKLSDAPAPRKLEWQKVEGFMPELRHGDENWHVDFLQRNLNRFLSPNIKVTGKYDDATASAVHKFYAQELDYKTTTGGKVFSAGGWRRVLSIASKNDGTV